MKWKIKSLILGSSAVLSLSPFAAALSGCAKEITFDALIKEMKADTIAEFQWVCKHYRETFHNQWFCDMLAARVKNMGFNPVYDTRTYLEGKYKPKQEKGEESAFGYNFYFDIPANDPENQFKPIILQAHTDMVCTVKEGVKYDWSQGVIPVIETIDGKTIMHTKDNLTSLGADDGIGLASILCLAKHHKDFQHGLIRCLFTVDEEDGESGAKYIDPSWLNKFDYYLNLDGEDANLTWTSSAGAQQTSWLFKQEASEISDPVDGTKQFSIVIAGFMGGHSGLKIQYHQMNPMVVMGKILQALIDDSSNYENVRLVESFDNNSKTANPNGGTVPSQTNFIVQTKTTKTKDDVLALVNNVLNDIHEHDEQQKGEPIDKLVKDVQDTTPTNNATFSKTGLSIANTEKLAKLLCNYEAYKLYGSWNYVEGRPTLGGNIAAIRIGKDIKKADSNNLYIEFFGRATEENDLAKFYRDNVEQYSAPYYQAAIANAFPGATGDWTDIAYNKPWLRLKQNNLRAKIHEAAESLDMVMLDDPCFGWLEPAEIYNIKPSLQLGALGPQLHDTHTIDESLEVDTIDNELRIIIYVMQNI